MNNISLKGKNKSINSLLKNREQNNNKNMVKKDFLVKAININKFATKDALNFLEPDTLHLSFSVATLVTNNKLLRQDNRDLFKYKKSWESRIKKLVSKNNFFWKNDDIFKLEFIYKVTSKKYFQDIDGLHAALKSVIDGLTLSGIILKDEQDFVPIQIPYQVVDKENPGLDIIITRITKKELYDNFTDITKKIITNYE